ncbi:esterase/lipase superfamily enzyme [Chelatococcus caeni]|uniref:Esterase/lipase superfamily enzyme n=1 Tax=Chelatococcus caeni TaxID=1348468 RepID=A0A840BRC5_9HYPH|nr:alpha/beta fold hydrolase [Chelatococcus caeni]MBB4016001.1 esterase/lipase superfamily enzyme [Chelatococcus caeni]
MPHRLSRRTLLRLALVNAGAVTLAGCSSAIGAFGGDSAPASALGSSPMGARGGPVVYAVTTRAPVNGASERPWFGSARAGGTRAVAVRFDPPPETFFGRIGSTLSGDWRINAVEALGNNDPVAALTLEAGGRDVLVYVHGYNQSFERAAIDAAELTRAIGFSGATVSFSWPSKEGLLDYGYDRESALWSRDAFQDLLEALVRNAMVGRVHIVAHSMGTLLTLETLRQLWAVSGSPDVAARFGAIVLASPDIDVDLFATGVKRIGPLAKHITVISSVNDRALAVSSRLAGGVSRVGAADRAVLEPLGVKIADASDYGWGIIRHDLFLTNKDVRGVIKRAVERRTWD